MIVQPQLKPELQVKKIVCVCVCVCVRERERERQRQRETEREREREREREGWSLYCIHLTSETLLLLLLSRFSRVRLCATPQTEAHQAPQSLGFSRQEHWSGLPFPSPMLESEKRK